MLTSAWAVAAAISSSAETPTCAWAAAPSSRCRPLDEESVGSSASAVLDDESAAPVDELGSVASRRHGSVRNSGHAVTNALHGQNTRQIRRRHAAPELERRRRQ